MSELLQVAREGGVTRLTFNRPEARNALSAELVEALLAALSAAATDGTRLLVLRGEGKAFCAGFDFGGVEQATDADLVHRFVRIEQMLQAIHHAPCTTLVLAHGACFGAGADLVAACDRRVAAPGTRFRMPGLRFGVVLGTRRLAALVGRDAARALLETTPVFDAARAAALGLVEEVAGEQDWPGVVEQAAIDAATLSPAARASLGARITADTRDADLAALVRSVAEPGLRERIVAFLAEARKPPA